MLLAMSIRCSGHAVGQRSSRPRRGSCHPRRPKEACRHRSKRPSLAPLPNAWPSCGMSCSLLGRSSPTHPAPPSTSDPMATLRLAGDTSAYLRSIKPISYLEAFFDSPVRCHRSVPLTDIPSRLSATTRFGNTGKSRAPTSSTACWSRCGRRTRWLSWPSRPVICGPATAGASSSVRRLPVPRCGRSVALVIPPRGRTPPPGHIDGTEHDVVLAPKTRCQLLA
jgi:hypothetical protein